MKIKESDFYYGIVLAQIAEYPVFTSINKPSKKEGLYLINDCKYLLIKYSTSDDGKWRFAISKNDIDELYKNGELGAYMIFVCAGQTICALDYTDLYQLIDKYSDLVQTICINYPDSGQMRLKGPNGKLSHKIAHNTFPKCIFVDCYKLVEHLAWPPFSKLNFYSQPPTSFHSSEDRMLDLVDTLNYDFNSFKDRTVYFGLSTISSDWQIWSEENLNKIEDHIRFQIEFDDLNVEIDRVSNVLCHYSKKQTVACYNEFIWKLHITKNNCTDGLEAKDIDESIKPNIDKIESDIRPITGDFPNFVFAKGKSVSPIEIDVDNLSQEEKFKYGGWEDIIKQLTSKWVSDNLYSGKGTIWAHGDASCNFNHKCYSMFYAVLGMPNEFREYLGAEINRILGSKYVRQNSDYVIPKTSEGWDARCHIEDSKTWSKWDDSAWQVNKV